MNHPKVPSEISEGLREALIVGSMVPKHLDLYEWGTSNPITSRLQSRHSEDFVSNAFWEDELGISSSGDASSVTDDPKIGGITTFSGVNFRTLAKITCGEASYLERVSPPSDDCWLTRVRLFVRRRNRYTCCLLSTLAGG